MRGDERERLNLMRAAECFRDDPDVFDVTYTTSEHESTFTPSSVIGALLALLLPPVPPSPPAKMPVARFERAADSNAMLFVVGDPTLRDLPPGNYVIYEADEPEGP